MAASARCAFFFMCSLLYSISLSEKFIEIKRNEASEKSMLYKFRRFPKIIYFVWAIYDTCFGYGGYITQPMNKIYCILFYRVPTVHTRYKLIYIIYIWCGKHTPHTRLFFSFAATNVDIITRIRVLLNVARCCYIIANRRQFTFTIGHSISWLLRSTVSC